MSKVYVFLADGFETVEALAPVDVIRRAGLEVVTVSIMKRKEVLSSHNVTVTADALYEDLCLCDAAAMVLPGGLGGTENLMAHELLCAKLKEACAKGVLVAAICAAPMVLGRNGLLDGRKATCYPGCESELAGAEYTAASVQSDGNIITGCGPAASFDFGFALVEYLCGVDTVAILRSQMQFGK